MEVFIAIAVWLLLGLPGYAVVLGDLQRDEWDHLDYDVEDFLIALLYLACGPIGSIVSIFGYSGEPLRLIPKQFDWRR